MAPNISFSSLALALLLLVASPHASGQEVKFSYNGSTGPDKWGRLCQAYNACGLGKIQSPINIKKDAVEEGKIYDPLNRDYKSGNATLVNRHFGVAVRFDSECGGMTIGGKRYTLKQFHWHTPSEHLIEGERYDAELHVVHMSEDKSFAVVSILFQYGGPDPFISKLRRGLEMLAKEKCGEKEEAQIALGNLSNKLLKKKSNKYYRYTGSLTTPPCSENVIWNVLTKVRKISKEQVESLRAPLDEDCKRNSRPVQPLNGRKVELYSKWDCHKLKSISC
ncbi:hypothetical protein K2173_012176 [Erythroxylum novogranatense]|uniref:Carbonic anhydrase n=1 Tax=Erythroxylum novogranatense TaxID=1862640 RepID=A0AAV8SRA7_9ROSI|nr:hypothetical protein K2173_012176 [Erythroxylum novogranatense]